MAIAFADIIDVQDLVRMHGSADLVVVDCRFELTRPDAGRATYAAGHIPGAVFADLEVDLSARLAPDGAGGRHPLPDPAVLRARLGQWGIGPHTQVVVYDAASGMIAARLWWLLRWLGHDRVAVLDGGWPAWLAAGQAATQALPEVTAKRFSGPAGQMPVLDADAVAAALARGEKRLVDVRAPERFRGELEPLDRRAGHVPGAVNLPLAMNLDADNRFLPAARLADLYGSLLGGQAADRLIVMCGSGVSACHALVAMQRAGLPGAALYAGSWSDWISDPARPLASV